MHYSKTCIAQILYIRFFSSFSGITAQKRLLTHPGEYISFCCCFVLSRLHFIVYLLQITPLVTLISSTILFTLMPAIAYYDKPLMNIKYKLKSTENIISVYCYIMLYLYGRVVPTSLSYGSTGTSSYTRSICYGLRWDYIQYTKKYTEYPVSRILPRLLGLSPGRT